MLIMLSLEQYQIIKNELTKETAKEFVKTLLDMWRFPYYHSFPFFNKSICIYILQMLYVCSCYLIRWWAMGLEPILTSVGSFRFTRLALVFLRQGNASLRICTHHENLNLLAILYFLYTTYQK